MANVLYTSYKASLLTTPPNLSSDTIKVVLIDLADYTFSAAHDFFDDVPGAAVVATATLGTKTTTGGVFDSADPTFTAVTGDVSEALIIYKDTGSAATSPLIAFIDTGVTGLPVTPNGGNIGVTVNASGWFSI